MSEEEAIACLALLGVQCWKTNAGWWNTEGALGYMDSNLDWYHFTKDNTPQEKLAFLLEIIQRD